MKILFFVALVALCAAATAQPVDPCNAWNQEYTLFGASRADVLACFNSFTFDSNKRNTLVSILRMTWEAYSFHDTVSANLPPFNLNVRKAKHPLMRASLVSFASQSLLFASNALLPRFFCSFSPYTGACAQDEHP